MLSYYLKCKACSRKTLEAFISTVARANNTHLLLTKTTNLIEGTLQLYHQMCKLQHPLPTSEESSKFPGKMEKLKKTSTEINGFWETKCVFWSVWNVPWAFSPAANHLSPKQNHEPFDTLANAVRSFLFCDTMYNAWREKAFETPDG